MTGPLISDALNEKVLEAFKDISLQPLRKGLANQLRMMSNEFDKHFIDPYQKAAKGMKKPTKHLTKGISVLTNVIGVFLQIIDAMGVLEPIMSLFHAVLSIMGGAAMELLGPVLEKVAEVLFSDEMIEVWQELGKLFAIILIPILNVFMIVLKAIAPIIKILAKLFGPILGVHMEILARVIGLLIISALLPLIFVIYAVGLVFTAIMDIFMNLVQWGWGFKFSEMWSDFMLGGMIAPILQGMGEIITMQHGGIVTSATPAIIGEAGPEAVIPLDSSTGQSILNNDQLIWATEDNGKKLDKLIYILQSKGRLR